MIGYMDRTWCTQSTCKNFGHGCDRALTDEVKKLANAWWGKEGAPVRTFHPDEKPECFVPSRKIQAQANCNHHQDI